MTRDIRDEFRSAGVVVTDLVDLLLGELLGGGIDRQVFVLAQDPRWVVKIEADDTDGRFQNIGEWRVWRELQFHEPSARWLAPCRSISPNGRVLIQARTSTLPTARLPERVPVWATDLQPSNWGLYRGRPVMHDYGLTKLAALGSQDRTKKAHW